MKIKKKNEIAEIVTKALEIPFEALSGVAKITLSGNLSLTVDGHRGIMDYSENAIKLAMANQILLICGRGLEIASISPELVTVEGHITKIEFIMK